MDKNKTAVKEPNKPKSENKKKSEKKIHSRSSELNDLYKDLLSSLGTHPFDDSNNTKDVNDTNDADNIDDIDNADNIGDIDDTGDAAYTEKINNGSVIDDGASGENDENIKIYKGGGAAQESSKANPKLSELLELVNLNDPGKIKRGGTVGEAGGNTGNTESKDIGDNNKNIREKKEGRTATGKKDIAQGYSRQSGGANPGGNAEEDRNESRDDVNVRNTGGNRGKRTQPEQKSDIKSSAQLKTEQPLPTNKPGQNFSRRDPLNNIFDADGNIKEDDGIRSSRAKLSADFISNTDENSGNSDNRGNYGDYGDYGNNEKKEKKEKKEKRPKREKVEKKENENIADIADTGVRDEKVSTHKNREKKAKNKTDEKSNAIDEDLLKAFGIVDEDVAADYDGDDAGTRTRNKKRRVNARTGARLKSMRKVANREYSSYEQNEEIFANYGKIYASERIKLILSSVCLLLLAYLETAPYLKLPLPFVLDINFYNVVYIWVNIQLLLIVAALNYKSLIFGIRSFFASSVNVYYVSVFFMILSIIQTAVTFHLRYNNPDIVLFNSVTALGMVLISLYNILDINVEIMGFKVIAAKRPKYAMRLNENALLEMESFRSVIPEDTIVGNIVRTQFVSNFFSRTYRNKNYGTYEKYFVMISVPVSFLLFAIMLGIKTDVYSALSTVMTVLCGSLPLCSVIVSVYPLYTAQKKAYATKAAIIGANAVYEHSDISILSVYDSDIFPPEQIQNSSGVRVYGNNRLDMILQHLRAIFEKLNLSVAEVFKSSPDYAPGFDANVSVLGVNDDGVYFLSNGTKLFMGNSEYISNMGLTVPVEPNYDEQFEKSSGSILFLATEWEVLSKVYIKYEKIADFYDIIKSLNSSSICLGIRTFDPNINNALLSKITNTKKFPVKIVKLKELSDISKIHDNMSSGIVSKSTLKSVIQTVLLCGKTKNIIKSNGLIQLIAFVIGTLLTVGIAVTGIIYGETWQMHSGYILLFHSFWTIIILFLSSV